jgi:hypothetical protein
LRLWLALLLAVLPLLSAAQTLPTASANPEARAVSEMPCHAAARADDGHSMADRQDAPCPHCSSDAPSPLCQCSGHTPPSGLSERGWRPTERTAALAPLSLTTPTHLPQSPDARLFRPPISGN